MKYTNGFLSADISDTEKSRKIGKEVEKGNCEFSHFAMDRCYYRKVKSKKEINEINATVADELQSRKQTDSLDQAIEKQKAFIRGEI